MINFKAYTYWVHNFLKIIILSIISLTMLVLMVVFLPVLWFKPTTAIISALGDIVDRM